MLQVLMTDHPGSQWSYKELNPADAGQAARVKMKHRECPEGEVESSPGSRRWPLPPSAAYAGPYHRSLCQTPTSVNVSQPQYLCALHVQGDTALSRNAKKMDLGVHSSFHTGFLSVMVSLIDYGLAMANHSGTIT